MLWLYWITWLEPLPGECDRVACNKVSLNVSSFQVEASKGKYSLPKRWSRWRPMLHCMDSIGDNIFYPVSKKSQHHCRFQPSVQAGEQMEVRCDRIRRIWTWSKSSKPLYAKQIFASRSCLPEDCHQELRPFSLAVSFDASVSWTSILLWRCGPFQVKTYNTLAFRKNKTSPSLPLLVKRTLAFFGPD